MKHSDQSTENDLGGDVSGTAFQAGSIEINVGAPGRRWRRGIVWGLSALAVVAVAGAAVALAGLMSPDERAVELPASVTGSITAEPSIAPEPPPTTDTPAPQRATAGTARPAPSASVVRPADDGVVTPTRTTTTTAVSAAAGPTAPKDDVRYSGQLRFGSLHLDLPQPRDIPGTNVWPLTPGRLHGDPGYWLAEWITDGVPGRSECKAHLAQRATQDAENLVAGSVVCGQTPEGRIFRIEVTTLDEHGIAARVQVWEKP